MTKAQAKKKIKELINEYKGIKKRDEVGLYNEETTKQRFIQPLFKALGWDFKVDVWPEEKVSKGRVDYAFKLNNITKFFVETKSLKIGLDNPDYDKQVINYGWLKDITWVVLTNFEELKIFNSELKEENLVLDLTYDRYLKDFNDLWRLSKEAFIKGELDRWAEKYGKKAKRLKVGEQLFEDLMEWRKFLFENASLFLDLSKEEISEGVQKILDRLIFIRTAEDRGIEEKILLPKLREWEDKGRNQEFMEVLSKIFRDFDEGYNSELFAPHDCEKWKLGTEVLEKVVKGLYKTKDDLDYDFSAIDSDVLGGIYEQYLGHLLKMTKGEAKVISGRAKRKEKGIYYTPKFIVDYIVKGTLGEVLKNKKPNEIRKLKVLDPACGSGSFLQRAHQEIVDYLEEKKSEVKDEKSKLGAIARLKREKEGRKELSVAQKIEILRNNIYGVDLDHQAVEIARLNLLLKVLDKRMKLPLLDDTIKEGNSLISGDEKELKKYFGDKWKEKKPFNWEEEFEEVFKQGGFDVIIGNPPYGAELSEKERKFIAKKFKIGSLYKNTALLFIEKSLELLNKNGYFSMIVPKSLAFSQLWKNGRDLIKQHLIKIVDVSKAFEDVLLEQIIIVLKKNSRSRNYVLEDLSSEQTITIHKKFIDLTDSFILHGEKEDFKIFRKINKGARYLSAITETRRGLPFQKYLTKERTRYPVIKGKTISRYKFELDEGYLPEKMIEQNKIKFLLKPKIISQRIVAHVTKPKEHIIIMSALDKDGFLTVDTVENTVITNDKYSLEFLLCLLNSKLVSWYTYRYIFSKAIRTMDLDKYYLGKIPLPNIEINNRIFIKLANKILKLNKELQKFGDKITDKRKKIEKEIGRIDRKIDEVVYRLYNLTEEEIKIIEKNEH